MSIKKMLTMTKVAYVEWILNSRQIVALICLLCLGSFVGMPLNLLSTAANVPINFFEPFIAAANTNVLSIIIIGMFLMLVCDFPRLEGNNGYLLIRTSRLSWLFSRVIFIILSSLTYIIYLFVFLSFWCIKTGFIADGWSYIMKEYFENYVELGAQSGVNVVLSNTVFNSFTPYEAIFYTIVFLFFYLIVIQLVMMTANFLSKKIIGIIANFIILLLGIGLAMSYSKFAFVLPLGNTLLASQNTPTHSLLPIWSPFVYFGLLIAILLLVNIILCKKITIQKDGER